MRPFGSGAAAGYQLRFEDVCFSLGQIVSYGFLAAVFIRETINGYRRFQGPRCLTTGAFVRIWFLGLLAIGLSLKTIVVIAIYWYIRALNKPPIPFTVAWSHCLPSLVMLSGYSMAAVFFAEVCCKSNSIDLPLLTPFLVGSNALMYILFSVVTSITKLRHAHREFRIAAYSLIGVSHLILALAWLYFGIRLQRQLKSRTSQLTSPVIYTDIEHTPTIQLNAIKGSTTSANTHISRFTATSTNQYSTQHSQMSAQNSHRSTQHWDLRQLPPPIQHTSQLSSTVESSRAVLGVCPIASSRRIISTGSSSSTAVISGLAISLQQREVVTELLQRMIGLCWICPTLFAANGILELLVAAQLYRAAKLATPPPNVDYYIEWSTLNALLCGTQLMPAIGVALLMWPEFYAWTDYYGRFKKRWWPDNRVQRFITTSGEAARTFPFLVMHEEHGEQLTAETEPLPFPRSALQREIHLPSKDRRDICNGVGLHTPLLLNSGKNSKNLFHGTT